MGNRGRQAQLREMHGGFDCVLRIAPSRLLEEKLNCAVVAVQGELERGWKPDVSRPQRWRQPSRESRRKRTTWLRE